MPEFRIYSSNRTELLAEKLATELRRSTSHPLKKETVLVQSGGMEKWLSLRIAEINGICANVNFPFPRHFTKNLFRTVTGLPDFYPFNCEIMTWNIMGFIPELLGMKDFKAAADYVSGEDSELKTFQLASRIAATFDQYLVYRPDMLLEWDAGRNPMEKFRESRWQFELWKKLSASAGSNAKHLAAMRLDFMEKIKSADKEKLPDAVHVFGITGMPLFYVEMLQALSYRIDVVFYYMTPSRQFWSDTRSLKEISKMTLSEEDAELLCFDAGNELLSSLGRSGREFFAVLFSLDDTVQEDIYKEPGDDTLLHSIQSDILELRGAADRGKRKISDDDSSIMINSCHSRLREIEVLHDNLIDIFAHENIRPGDVAVMAPDISIYASAVEAVFGTPESEQLRIPFSIADRPPVSGSSGSVPDLFLEILSLGAKRVTAQALMNIIESRHVSSNFGLDGMELAQIRSWAAESGMRWAIDENDKVSSGLPPYRENTVSFGMDRMLLGSAMNRDADCRMFENIMPMDIADGNDSVTLGIFLRVCRDIKELVTELRKPHTLREWRDIANSVIEKFFSSSKDSENEIQELRKLLSESGLSKAVSFSDFKKTVSIRVMLSFLKGALNVSSGRAGFLSNGVTFCTMQPMRCVPFKVICLLGMNEGEYPVNPPRPAFDLREKARKFCDPSKRHEDRYVFLESILSAREKLIISYVGQDIKENTQLPPSVLVSELTDYTDSAFESGTADKVSDLITVMHPLQPFSPRYFDGADKKFFSYSAQNMKGAVAASLPDRRTFSFSSGRELPELQFMPETISNETLIKFFRHPAKYFVNERLKIRFPDGEISELEDDENFEFDSLESYNILQRLTELVIRKCPFEKAFEIFNSEGLLPHGAFGRTSFIEFYEKAEMFADNTVLKQITGSGKLPKPLHGEITTSPGFTFRLSDIYNGGQLFHRCSGIKAKDRVRAWINHLSLCMADSYDGTKKTYLVGKDKVLCYESLPPENASAIVEQLIAMFIAGNRKALPFFPETSLEFAFEADIAAALKKWNPSYTNSFPDNTDSYNLLCFNGELPDDFARISETFFGPLLENEKELEGSEK